MHFLWHRFNLFFRPHISGSLNSLIINLCHRVLFECPWNHTRCRLMIFQYFIRHQAQWQFLYERDELLNVRSQWILEICFLVSSTSPSLRILKQQNNNNSWWIFSYFSFHTFTLFLMLFGQCFCYCCMSIERTLRRRQERKKLPGIH